MQTSSANPKVERDGKHQQPKGNWMHLTIAPLVEQWMAGKKSLPGTEREIAPRKYR